MAVGGLMSDVMRRREYRASASTTRTVLVLVGLSLAGAAVEIATVGGMPGRLTLAVIVCLTALFVPLLAWSRRSATVISREGLTVKGLMRERRTTWRDIQGIVNRARPGEPS